jgi:hypothetical protein
MEGALRLSFAVPTLAAILLAATLPSAFAFEAVSNDQFPANTFSTRLADPDNIAADLAVQNNAQQFFGQNAQISHFGNVTVGIVQGSMLGPAGVGMMPERRW